MTRFSLLLGALLMLGSCATTKIHVDGPGAENTQVFLNAQDGVFVGGPNSGSNQRFHQNSGGNMGLFGNLNLKTPSNTMRNSIQGMTPPVSLPRRGFPQSTIVEIRDKQGNLLNTAIIRRKFVFNTWTIVDLLYFPLLLTNFEYKPEYHFQLEQEGAIKRSPWETEYKSKWD